MFSRVLRNVYRRETIRFRGPSVINARPNQVLLVRVRFVYLDSLGRFLPGNSSLNRRRGSNGFCDIRILFSIRGQACTHAPIVSAVFVRRLRQLQEEPRTVLPTPAVASAGRPASAQRDRARQGGGQGRAVPGQPLGRPTATQPAAAAERVRQNHQRGATAVR